MTENYRQSPAPSPRGPVQDETSRAARSRTRRFSRTVGAGLGALLIGVGALFAGGCLERPVTDKDPVTSNVFVNQVPINNIAAIDLLFMIDNSTSMADKQALLKQAVPKMVERLVTPDCVVKDEDGNVTSREASTAGAGGKRQCRDGTALEFSPVNDIHIGVITSSIGSHGYAATCDTIGTDIEPKTGLPKGQDKNDHAYLIPLVRLPDSPVSTYSGLSKAEPFLNWTGKEDLMTFTGKFANHVAAAGETGCGFESQLEAFYRFLVEPQPPKTINLANNQSSPSTETDPANGVDADLLAQRAQFLRPNSLVAVVVLTDENDCSVMEGGKYYPFAKYGHLAMNTGVRMKAPTDVCDQNPNDPCCDTCLSDKANEGCSESFAVCANKGSLTVAQDDGQERCFNHQRRFGFDLLYPVERYIDGLTRTKINDSITGAEVNNPLMIAADGTTRPAELVFFAGIVGVPWQDLATPDTLGNPNELKYLRTEELLKPVDGQSFSRWDVILGKPNHHKLSRFCLNNPTDASCGAAPVAPLDPFMVESIEARAAGQAHPIVAAEKTTMPGQWNNINGSEQINEDKADAGNKRNDLQYACIFPLKDYNASKNEAQCADAGPACDCDDEGVLKQRPLCRATPTGGLEKAQYWGKAYPGLRVLQVLNGIRPSNAIVASICPKVATEGTSYGYNPAVAAIIDRLAEKLGGQCLPRQLDVDDKGQVPCVVVETRAKSGVHPDPLDCGIGGPAGGRSVVDPQVQQAVYDVLTRDGVCFQPDTPADQRGPVPCEDYSMCTITQLSGGDGDGCRAGDEATGTAGYCYVDPEKGLGSAALVDQCGPNEKRLLRFVPNDGANPVATPANDTTLFVACIGSAAVKVNPTP